MKHSLFLLIPMLVACNESTQEVATELPVSDTTATVETNLDEASIDTTIATPIDTTLVEDITALLEEKAAALEQAMAENESLQHYMNYLKEEWVNVPNPLVAKYMGNDFGDYFHIIFEDAEGMAYDFGDGDNDFGNTVLFEGEHYDDDPKYLGKMFSITWEWKWSKFACCEGEYNAVEAPVPSITKLELID